MKKEDKAIRALDGALMLIALFAVMPFVLMFAWNTLAAHLFDTITIGYGGAWALMTLRTLLPKSYRPKLTPEESLQNTYQAYFNSAITVIITLIVGLSIGAL